MESAIVVSKATADRVAETLNSASPLIDISPKLQPFEINTARNPIKRQRVNMSISI